MRKVKITKIDQYGFLGRDRHPTVEMEGLTGLVVKSYYEHGTNSLSSDCDRDLVDVALDIADCLEICEVYLPSIGQVVTLVEHEFEGEK